VIPHFLDYQSPNMNLQTGSPSALGTFVSKPSIDIESLVKAKLPPLNSTVMKISQMLQDVNVSTRKLTEVIGCDPFLAARLIKMANSAAYSRKKAVTTIHQAVDSVGLKSLYDIVMLGAMADGFAKEISRSVYGRTIWQHSVAVGLLARELSVILDLRGAEESFLCGLLHDIGKILILKAETELFESIANKQSESEMLRAEEYTFGLNHSEIGAYVSYKWQMPETVCGVIMHHHDPSNAKISTVITHIVSAADLIANVSGYGLRFEEAVALDFSPSIAYLKLHRDQINLAWENIQESLKEIITMC
jgi:putative nucleotidyltransferase with HDIG domain